MLVVVRMRSGVEEREREDDEQHDLGWFGWMGMILSFS